MRRVLLRALALDDGRIAALRQDGAPYVSLGALVRTAMAEGAPLGLRIHEAVVRGLLVSDELLLELLAERLGRADAREGFVLDGFPRSVAQARALDALLARLGRPLDAALHVTEDHDATIERLIGHAPPGMHHESPDELRALLRRRDERLAPVVEFYRGQGKLTAWPGPATRRPEH